MNAFSLFRQGVLFAHAVAFAIALSAVLREDLALLMGHGIRPRRLVATARTVTVALAALWLTGLTLMICSVGLDAQALAASPKLAAKLVVVSVLTANGLALHTLALPILCKRRTQGRFGLTLPAVLGAISTVSWLYACFVGVARMIAPAVGFAGFLALYAALLCGAVTVSLVVVRPRIERLLAGPSYRRVGSP